MAATIYYKADEVWDYYLKHKDELKQSEAIIAQSDEYCTAILLSNVAGYCTIIVSIDDVPVYEESATCKSECQSIIEDIIKEYMIDDIIIPSEAPTEDEEMSIIEGIDYWESELNNAVYKFIDFVTEGKVSYGRQAQIVDDVKEHFLEYLARKYSMPIYRPMILEDEDGGEFVSDYPYEEMIFDDPDNPLYKTT